MSFFQNLMTSVLVAPIVTILSVIPLTLLQRAIDWIAFVSKNPQKGFLKQLRPYIQSADKVLERLLAGNKFNPSATNILLMAIVVLLITYIFTKQEETIVKIQPKNKEE